MNWLSGHDHALTCCICRLSLYSPVDQQLQGDTPSSGEEWYRTVNSGPTLVQGYSSDAVKVALDVGEVGEIGPLDGDEVAS